MINKEKVLYGSILVLAAGMLFASCDKKCKLKGETKEGYTLDETNCEWVKNPTKTCDYEQGMYNAAKDKVTADSTAWMDWKAGVPNVLNAMISKYINGGMTEKDAWEKAINEAISDPNCPADLKQWALTYKGLLDAFNMAVNERQETQNALTECENSKNK